MKEKSKGFSLLELMLVLAFIVIASSLAYAIFKPSQIQAAVRQEQQNVGRMVDGIMGAYSTASNFSTLSTATVAGALSPIPAKLTQRVLHALPPHNGKPLLVRQDKADKLCKNEPARVTPMAIKCGPTIGKIFPAPAQQVA